MSENFSWDDHDSVVVESVSAIAIYSNPKGHIVIRQAARSDHDEDACVIVPPDHVKGLIEALQAELTALAAETDARGCNGLIMPQ